MTFARDSVRFRFTLPEQRVVLRPRPRWMPAWLQRRLLARLGRLAQGQPRITSIGRVDRWTLRHLVVIEQRAGDHGRLELIDWP